MEFTLYDQSGSPTAYIDDEDDNTIWTWDGYAVAYLLGEAVYGWNGQHIGWWISETLYDLNGHPTGYSANKCPRSLKSERIKRTKHSKRSKRSRRSLSSMRSLKITKSPTTLEGLLMSGSVH